MKKILTTALTAITGIALACGASACSNSSFGKDSAAQNIADAYGFSAGTAGVILSSMQGGSAANVLAAKSLSLRETVTDETTINELNQYMLLVESLLEDGGFSSRSEASDRAEYEVKLTVSYTDMLGNRLENVLYYNRAERGRPQQQFQTTQPQTETQTDESTPFTQETRLLASAPTADRDDWDDWDDRDDWDEEIEREYDITGILVVDGMEYPIRGEEESETDGDESELETEFIVQFSDTESMYVEQSVETERGEEEKKYEYSIRNQNGIVERCEFEYESERNDETEIEMILWRKGENGAADFSQVFYFEEDPNERNGMEIRVGSRESTQKYYVRIQANADGSTSYIYEYAGQSWEKYRD